MDGAQEVASRLVVARGDSPVLLEASKEVLDEMSGFVQVSIMVARLPVRCP